RASCATLNPDTDSSNTRTRDPPNRPVKGSSSRMRPYRRRSRGRLTTAPIKAGTVCKSSKFTRTTTGCAVARFSPSHTPVAPRTPTACCFSRKTARASRARGGTGVRLVENRRKGGREQPRNRVGAPYNRSHSYVVHAPVPPVAAPSAARHQPAAGAAVPVAGGAAHDDDRARARGDAARHLRARLPAVHARRAAVRAGGRGRARGTRRSVGRDVAVSRADDEPVDSAVG